MIRSLVTYAAWTPLKTSSTGQTLVLLSSVPTSCTLTDIRSLAYKPPKPGSLKKSPLQSAPRDSSSLSLAASITSIEFVRTMLLNQSGRVVVRLRDPNQAKEFAETASERLLGGNKIKAQVIDTAPVATHPTVKLLNALQRLSPGRVVMLRGLPSNLDANRVERLLHLSYSLATNVGTTTDEDGRDISLPAVCDLRDIPGGQDQNVAPTFLVRMETVSSANLLVRRWHRTVWHTKEEAMRQDHARTSGQGQSWGMLDDENVEQNRHEEYSERDDWSSRIRNRHSDYHDQDESQYEAPLRCVVDAYIMY